MITESASKKPYAARALIIQDGQVLMIHHRFKNPSIVGKWTLPGGRLAPHETDPLEALHREIREELSVGIEVIANLGCFYNRSGLEYYIFLAKKLGPIGPLQKEEIQDMAWLMPAEIYELHAKDKLQFGFEMDAILMYLREYVNAV